MAGQDPCKPLELLWLVLEGPYEMSFQRQTVADETLKRVCYVSGPYQRRRAMGASHITLALFLNRSNPFRRAWQVSRKRASP